ncbi:MULTISPECIES: hypothetical protein [Cupriavidus]|uniref:hypothetical protein n=1 Tax=Cupriavidus TaxID=106589 RepID=UPI001601BFE6|nr:MULTISPECIES: hypothetical protein [Cupriavidus]MBB1635242.1 hypothetical protein [Cupriavidus sp. UME77]MCP3024749.1 hypothetical protein [Cupriavidus basilensis]
MQTAKISLRGLIDKWLGSNLAAPARITRVRSSRACRSGCIRVDVARPSGQLSMFFFRHADGCWCVFPPALRVG